jgi:predicted Zn-dependent protease
MALKESKVARKGSARAKKPEPPRKKAPPPPRPPDEEKAIEEFAAAVKLFHKRDLQRAREQFKALMEKYPLLKELGDRARTYIQVCDRSAQSPTPRLKDANDYYYQGVILMNRSSVEEASRMFEKALALEPGNEKVLYGQAACLALSGRPGESIDLLRRAIAGNASNRALAANDPDFESLRDDSEFRSIIYGRGGDAA